MNVTALYLSRPWLDLDDTPEGGEAQLRGSGRPSDHARARVLLNRRGQAAAVHKVVDRRTQARD